MCVCAHMHIIQLCGSQRKNLWCQISLHSSLHWFWGLNAAGVASISAGWTILVVLKRKLLEKKKKFAFTRRYWEVVKLKPECFTLQCPTETSVVWVCLPVHLYVFLAFFFSLVSLLSVFLSICFILFNFFFLLYLREITYTQKADRLNFRDIYLVS